MALWGNNDSKTATGTVTITKNADGLTGNVVGSSTTFTTEAEVGNYIVAEGNNYLITAITNTTFCTVTSGIHGANVVAQSGGTSYALSEKPAFVAASEASENKSATSIFGNAENVYGVSAGEATAAREEGTDRVAHAGWVRRWTGSGGRSGRVFHEVLVAGGSIAGDLEDVVFEDYVLSITTQPTAQSANATADETATFTVVAASVPTGATLTYAWTYANGDTIAVGETANTTTASLEINANTAVDATEYKVVVGAAGADSVTSSNVAITVTT